MQPVVRLSLLGILAFAGLTACGDKVQVTHPPPDRSSVHSVTVSPPAASVAVNGTSSWPRRLTPALVRRSYGHLVVER